MTFEPDRHDFTIRKDTSFDYSMVFYTDATRTQPFNLTGYTASMPIRSEAGGTILLTLNTANGGVQLGGSSGSIIIQISLSGVNALTWQRGVYQLTITAPGGNTDPLLWGTIIVKPT